MINVETIKINERNSQYTKNENLKINNTLQGVLVNSHLRTPACYDKFSFEDIEDSLLISKSKKYYSSNNKLEYKNSTFDTKKALTPLFAGTAAIAGGCFMLSNCLKKSSKNLLNTKNFEHLPDLAINMNIREEPQFAIYRAIRDPNFANIIGAAGVFIMSGITLACKNFVDGTKEIWIKKRNADIEKNLQENLISVDRDTFSGKLKVVNDMMNKNIQYFDAVLNSQSGSLCPDIASFSHKNKSDIFAPFLSSFKGKKTSDSENIIEKDNKNKNFKYMALVMGVITGSAVLGKFPSVFYCLFYI